MEKQRRINTFVICGLMVVVGVMTVGFAALSQQLNITGTAVVKSASSSWNVYFSNVSTSTEGLTGTGTWSTAPAISTDTSGTGTNNKISFACDLVAPGDSCTVTATIKNGGTTKAKYTGHTFTVDSNNQTGNSATLTDGVVVTLTPAADWTADTTVLDKDDTGTFIIKMELPATATKLPESEATHNVSVSINFTQSQ